MRNLCRQLFALSLLHTLSFLTHAIAADGEVTFGAPVVSKAGSIVNPGDVYGTADFEISNDRGSVEDALSGLSRALISNGSRSGKGSYLMTVELSQNGKVISQKPIISVTFENEKFLFVNISKSLSSDINFGGNLYKSPAVDDTNNEVDVVLKSYFKDDSTFDLTLFDLMDDINSVYPVIDALDATGISKAALDKIRSSLTKILQRSTEVEELFRYTMAFAQLPSASTNVRQITIPIRFSSKISGRRQSGSLLFKLRLWSISSKFDFDSSTKRYIRPSSYVILSNTSIPSANGSLNIVDYLKVSGSESTRKFLSSLFSPAGYVGGAAASECASLLSNFRRYLSNRDALALMWATLSEYRGTFKSSNAGECFSSRASDFDRVGLPTNELRSYFQGD